MKLCIFSDIHGNNMAFEQMYQRERSYADVFIFAGDIFGYFYGQKEVIDIFMSEKNLLAVKGNHDQNYLQMRQGRLEKNELLEQYGSSYNLVLPKDKLLYLEKLPECLDIKLGGKKVGIFHGGIKSNLNQRIYPNTKIECRSIAEKYDYLILGHTHYQLLLTYGTTMLINPGSLGQPRDKKGFSYCILDTKTNQCEFKTIQINIKQLLREVENKDFNKLVFTYLNAKYEDMR